MGAPTHARMCCPRRQRGSRGPPDRAMPEVHRTRQELRTSREVLEGGEGGGVWDPNVCVYQNRPKKIFPIVNFVMSHCGYFGLEGGVQGGLPPCVTFRLVVVPLRGPGRSPVLPFACCVRSLLSVGRCGGC